MKKILCLVLGLSLIAPAFATKAAEGKKMTRMKKQRVRIQKGVKSGRLTKAEAKQLHQDGKAIRAEQKAAKADGVVTAEERAKLKTMKNERSRAIKAEKYDAQGNRKKQVRHAVKKGKISKEQAVELKQEGKAIKEARKEMKANDGQIDATEKSTLQKMREGWKSKWNSFFGSSAE